MGGKSKKVTVGYWYRMDVLMTLCHKVDEVVEIRSADRLVWRGVAAISQTIKVFKAKLFGGEKREGGLEGFVDIMLGEDDMEFNSYLASSMRNANITGPIPTYRGLTSLFFRGPITVNPEFPAPTSFQKEFPRLESLTDIFGKAKPFGKSFAWSAMNPYFKPLKVKVRRYSKGWREDISRIVGTDSITEYDTIDLNANHPLEYFIYDLNAVAPLNQRYVNLDIPRDTRVDVTKALTSEGGAYQAASYNGVTLWNNIMYYWHGQFDFEEHNFHGGGGYTTAGEAEQAVVDYGNPVFSRTGPMQVQVGWSQSKYASGSNGFIDGDDGTYSENGGGLSLRVEWVPLLRVARTIYADPTEVIRITKNTLGGSLAWSPWATDSGHTNPWTNKFTVRTDDTTLTHYWTSTGADTAEDSHALAENLVVELTGSSKYEIGLYDTLWEDNRGGLSLIVNIQRKGLDMNPAHIIRECITNTEFGMGYPSSDLDNDQFEAVAETLHDEGFGLSLKWDQNMEIQEFIRIILNHISGVLVQNRSTGKLFIKLIRNDYSIPALMEFNESNCSVESFSRSSSSEIINEVTLRYTLSSGETDAVTVQDLAGISSQGQIISQEIDMPGITNVVLATRVAQRELESRVKPVAKVTLRADRKAFKLYEGDVFKLVWPQLNISQMICRILKMDMGSLSEGTIIIEAVEDVFGFPESSYLQPQYSDAPLIDNDAVPSPVRYITETPYYDLARTLSQVDLNALEDVDATLDVFAKAPADNYISYSLWTASSPNTVEERGKANHPGTATILSGLGKTESSVITLSEIDTIIQQLDSENNYAIINGEYVAITDYDTVNDTITVNRGVLDTVPAVHAAGSTFFIGNDAAQDEVNYVTGETVLVRVQTFTSSDELTIDEAPQDSYTMIGRQGRPYPPGKLRINGLVYPTNIGLTDGLSLTWAHRNRLTQTANIIAQSNDSITPEASATYNLRIYDNDVDVLLRAETGLTGTSYNYTTLNELADKGGVEEAYWSSVALLLNFNGTNGSTTFTDSSSTPKTVTTNGNAQVSTAQSKFGGASALFDGTGDYLSVAYSSALDVGTGDFVIEFWLRPGSTSVGQALVDWRDANQNKGLLITQPTADPTKIRFAVGDSNNTAFEVDITSTTSVSVGTWYHVAAARLGDTYLLFINGVTQGVVTNSVNPYINSSSLRIGIARDNTVGFNGHIDDFRLTKAYRYKDIFTVPSAEFTSSDPSWANVKLLLNMNGANGSTTFTDSSTSARTVTPVGNAQISTAQSKFGGASALFDGTGDYLTVPHHADFSLSSGDFTIESWVYPNSVSKQMTIASKRVNAGSNEWTFGLTSTGQLAIVGWTDASSVAISTVSDESLVINQWSHVAATREGNTWRLFIDGRLVSTAVQSGTIGSNTTVLRIGRENDSFIREWEGYIDSLRVTRECRYKSDFTPPVTELSRWQVQEEPNWANVSLLLNMNGTNGSTTFTDSSSTPKTVTANGNAQISTAQSKFGGASALFDGTGDYLSIPTSTDFDLGSTYTIEFWIRPTLLSSSAGILLRGFYTNTTQTWDGLAFSIRWLSSGFARFYFYGTTVSNEQYIDVTDCFVVNTWKHCAMVRNGSVGQVYIDGVLVGSVSGLNTPAASTQTLRVGLWDYSAGSEYFNGHIDDLRITKGVARYTANFTPPDQELARYIQVSPTLSSKLRFELESERGGLVSWQKHNHTVHRYVYSTSMTSVSTITATLVP